MNGVLVPLFILLIVCERFEAGYVRTQTSWSHEKNEKRQSSSFHVTSSRFPSTTQRPISRRPLDIEGVWENVEEECKERCAMCLFFDCFCIGQEYKRCLERCKSEKGAVVAKQLKTSNRFK
ncbi:hypothetical protein M514_21876 [Trichuris suis]|uniref:Uncharacterized protein n=1 Tax=Trichuris suis TaxID=68888 RepID=A0A085N8W7_9BILA|nr:hypothetical protein M514_21876 [Trichuris suis]